MGTSLHETSVHYCRAGFRFEGRADHASVGATDGSPQERDRKYPSKPRKGRMCREDGTLQHPTDPPNSHAPRSQELTVVH
jgi:hypothetical protein